jgi:hypothetical protein
MEELSLKPSLFSASLFDYRFVIFTITVCLLFVGTSRLSAETVACSNPMFSVETSELNLTEHICAVAAAAAKRLAACHIPQRDAIKLHVVDGIAHEDSSCLGTYKPSEKILQITSPTQLSAVIDQDHIFSKIPALELFDSLIFHELTHALLDQRSGGDKQCYANHEYMAYSMQMEALSPVSRQIIIVAAGGHSEISREQLNGFVAMVEPTTFAAWSWLHFSEPQNGCDFFEKLTTGEISLELLEQ